MNLTNVHANSEGIGKDIKLKCVAPPKYHLQLSTSAMSDLAWGARTHGVGEGSELELSAGSSTQDRPHHPRRFRGGNPTWIARPRLHPRAPAMSVLAVTKLGAASQVGSRLF